MRFDCNSCKYETYLSDFVRCVRCYTYNNVNIKGGWIPKETKDCNACEDLNCNSCWKGEYEVNAKL